MTATDVATRMQEIDLRQSYLERRAKDIGGGELEGDDKVEYDALDEEFHQLYQRHKAMINERRTQPNSGGPVAFATEEPPLAQSLPRPKWINAKTGEPVRTYQPTERFSAAHVESVDLSVGRFMQAVATGNWREAEAERRVMNLTGNDTSGGHYLVPDPLSAMVIDLARAASVVFRWGATSVDMTADTLRIARVASDPKFGVYGEGVEITESNPTFDSVELVSRKIATIVTASRELAEDAPNFASLIEDTLRRGLGAEFDRLLLIGNGGGDGFMGVANTPNIGNTGSVGAIAWEDFHTAAVAIRALNHEPNGIVLHPTILGDAQILTSGDGTNSAKLWLGPPPSLEGLAMLPTTNVGTGTAIVGDGRRMLVGFRTQARVEVSTEAGDRFAKHQIAWKITLRTDLALTHTAAFHSLTGITT